ncbi:MAG TPA: hypothetical protein VN372_12120 [Methanospirillum sp.]|nr:hypothetical protein [Methanospirillum sp.]
MNPKKLFIGNLTFSVTDNQLRNLLSPYGDVIGVKVIPDKGYAFVEMGTPEQARKIQETLSESIFEGRRLLIDSVPSKEKANLKKTARPEGSRWIGQMPGQGRNSNQRGYSSETRGPSQSTRSYGKPIESERPIKELVAIERPAQPVKTKQTTPQAPKKPDKVIPDRITQRPAPKISEKTRPEKPLQGTTQSRQPAQRTESKKDQIPGNKKPQHSPRQNEQKSGKPSQSKRDADKGWPTTKPKKIKEKPPKNPHPYQGSKKSKKPVLPKEESRQAPGDSPRDNEKQEYLQHWAAHSKKDNK